MKLMSVLAWSFALGAAPASAQAVYRCGNTYSQTPCAVDAMAARIGPGAAPDKPADRATGAALCIATATRHLGLTAAEAARVLDATKAPAMVIQYADQPMAVRQFIVTAQARAFLCFLSEDEARVLKFTTPAQHATDSAPSVAAGPAGISSPGPKQMTPYEKLVAERAKRDAEEASVLRATMRGAQRVDPAPTPRR